MSIWLVDADGLQKNSDILSKVYENRAVRDFLSSKSKLGIIGSKGQGKTFLLTKKRIMIMNELELDCIPSNRLLDTLTQPIFNKKIEKFVDDYSNWVYLWEISIALSIIKKYRTIHYESIENDNNFNIFKKYLDEEYMETPCQYLNHILTLDNVERGNIIEKTTYLVNMLDKNVINNGIAIFIDKIDQALEFNLYENNKNFGTKVVKSWQYAQFALADVAYSIFTRNNHIKIYYGIRPESLSGMEYVQSYENITLQYATKLNYSKKELREMYQFYIRKEKDENLLYPEYKFKKASYAFLGVEKLKHSYVKKNNKLVEEDIFDYIYRHTLGRPRDVMRVCNRLFYEGSNNDKIIDSKLIKHVVNREGNLILSNYFYSNEALTYNLKKEDFKLLRSIINTNVFTLGYAKYICKRINRELGYSFYCNENCEACNGIHPISFLLNVGLIGYINENNNANNNNIIKFKNSADSIFNLRGHNLPFSKLYFLHPLLTNLVENTRKMSGREFDICKNIIVSNHDPIKNRTINAIIKKEELIFKKIETEKVFVSSTIHDLESERITTKRILNNFGLDVVMSDSKEFGTPPNGTDTHDYCIDKMLECQYVIFIQGKRYGGEYKGTKYNEYAYELRNKFPDIKWPSVTLMEFYVAKKNKKNVFALVSKKVIDERLSFINNKHYNPVYVEDNRTFFIVDILNKGFEEGIWYNMFTNIENLSENLTIQFKDWNKL